MTFKFYALNTITYTIITFFLLAACSRKIEVIGIYNTDRYSRAEKFSKSIVNKTWFVVGSSLEVNEDSTFHYQTCGNIMDGNWHIQRDSLVLDIDSNRWRSDSLQENGLLGRKPGSDFDLTFKINGDCLIQIKKPKDGIGSYYLRLKKAEKS